MLVRTVSTKSLWLILSLLLVFSYSYANLKAKLDSVLSGSPANHVSGASLVRTTVASSDPGDIDLPTSTFSDPSSSASALKTEAPSYTRLAPSIIGPENVQFSLRNVSTEDWMDNSLRCRYEDCLQAELTSSTVSGVGKSIILGGAPSWSPVDRLACFWALRTPQVTISLKRNESWDSDSTLSRVSERIISKHSPCAGAGQDARINRHDSSEENCTISKGRLNGTRIAL